MKRIQFEPLTIFQIEEEEFHVPMHGQNYYELIFIKEGTGRHIINGNYLPYTSGSIFFVSPEDEHHFEIFIKTIFVFILFTDDYFLKRKLFQQDGFLLESPSEMMRYRVLKERVILFDTALQEALRATVDNIMKFHKEKDMIGSGWFYYQLLSLFALIKNGVRSLDIQGSLRTTTKEDIVFYIHQHIYKPELIRRSIIAQTFHLSESYFSRNFKQNFGVSYQVYINKYKIELIEKRLSHARNTIKQIAEEFGFVDESHLSHFFKRIKGVSPARFRKGI